MILGSDIRRIAARRDRSLLPREVSHYFVSFDEMTPVRYFDGRAASPAACRCRATAHYRARRAVDGISRQPPHMCYAHAAAMPRPRQTRRSRRPHKKTVPLIASLISMSFAHDIIRAAAHKNTAFQSIWSTRPSF